MADFPEPLQVLLKVLRETSAGSVAGQDRITAAQSELAAGLAVLLCSAIESNTEATHASARLLHETTAKSAKLISEDVEKFIASFQQFGQRLDQASNQSDQLADD